MKKTKRILQALGAFAFAWLMLWDTTASASIQCSENNGMSNGFRCSNSKEGGASLVVRQQPGWGGNAGYIVVDMCPSLENSALQSPVQDAETPSCLRRICDNNTSEFAIKIAATPIPIAADLWIGFAIALKRSEFTIECRTLGEQEGDAP